LQLAEIWTEIKMPVAKVKRTSVRVPVWAGPEVDGVTQSLLARYLVCKERFRLLVIEGLKEAETFRHALEFGSAWHVCEEALAARGNWQDSLRRHCAALAIKWRESANQVDHWYNVIKVQFPHYVEYWRKHPDVKKRQPICQETEFAETYTLPSGRRVLLRGKFDAVDLIDKQVYIQENKAKGDPNEQQILRQLTNDLQTMTYAVVADNKFCLGRDRLGVFGGARYNVIRRPLAGGKFSITQHKGRKTKKGLVGVESREQFYARLGKLIGENASHFFMRWRVEISNHDLYKFQHTFLVPVLENLCDDYDLWRHCYTTGQDVFQPTTSPMSSVNGQPRNRHFVLPYGVYNSLAEGGSTPYDDYLATGSEIGLERTTNLFPELSSNTIRVATAT
jgi:hypothetical protein